MRLFVLVVIFIATFQIRLIAEKTSLSGEDVETVLWPVPAEISLGKMLQGEVRNITVTLQNKAPFDEKIIDKLAMSCNCIEGKLSVDRIPPKCTAQLTLKVVAGFSKAILKQEIIVVYHGQNEDKPSVLRIPITASVETVAELSSRRISFEGAFNDLKAAKVNIAIEKGTSSSLIWSSVIPEADSRCLLAVSEERDGKTSIVVAPRMNNLQFGKNRGILTLKYLNDADKIIFQDYIPYLVKLQPPITIEPPSFYIPSILTNTSQVLTFVITSAEINLQDCVLSVSNPNLLKEIKIKYLSDTKAVFQVMFTPLKEGAFNEYVKLKFKGQHQGSVEVPVLGIASGE